MATTKKGASKASSKKATKKKTPKNKGSVKEASVKTDVSDNKSKTPKQEKIAQRRYLVALYRAQGFSYEKILKTLLEDHSIKISSSQLYGDIREIEKQNVKALEKVIKGFDQQEYWSSKIKEIQREREELWAIVDSPSKTTGTAVQALKRIGELREEEERIYQKLGINIVDPEAGGSKDRFLVIGHPQPGDKVEFGPDGSIIYKK